MAPRRQRGQAALRAAPSTGTGLSDPIGHGSWPMGPLCMQDIWLTDSHSRREPRHSSHCGVREQGHDPSPALGTSPDVRTPQPQALCLELVPMGLLPWDTSPSHRTCRPLSAHLP
uniref:Uncharacterized protein n=1 Tax=Chrysemys picta bellii TaxID=8478 RepID=A0A8C3F6E4_CHRPI